MPTEPVVSMAIPFVELGGPPTGPTTSLSVELSNLMLPIGVITVDGHPCFTIGSAESL